MGVGSSAASSSGVRLALKSHPGLGLVLGDGVTDPATGRRGFRCEVGAADDMFEVMVGRGNVIRPRDLPEVALDVSGPVKAGTPNHWFPRSKRPYKLNSDGSVLVSGDLVLGLDPTTSLVVLVEEASPFRLAFEIVPPGSGSAGGASAGDGVGAGAGAGAGTAAGDGSGGSASGTPSSSPALRPALSPADPPAPVSPSTPAEVDAAFVAVEDAGTRDDILSAMTALTTCIKGAAASEAASIRSRLCSLPTRMPAIVSKSVRWTGDLAIAHGFAVKACASIASTA